MSYIIVTANRATGTFEALKGTMGESFTVSSMAAARRFIEAIAAPRLKVVPEATETLDWTKPLETSDGFSVELQSWEYAWDGSYRAECILPEGWPVLARGPGRYMCFDRDGHAIGYGPNFKLRNVDTSVPEYRRAARRAYAGLTKEARAIPFKDMEWYQPFADTHFARLIDRDGATMLAFYENEKKLELGRLTEMRVGRYIRRFSNGKLLDHEIEVIVAEADTIMAGSRLQFTQDADTIEAIYVHGPRSCMAYSAGNFSSSCHPTRVYAGPDLAVAYIGDPEEGVSGRAIVWPDRKVYGGVYGDCSRMVMMLEAEGYTRGSFHGARGRAIWDRYDHHRLIMPYLDVESGVDVDGEYVILGGSEWDCQRTDGYADGGSRAFCQHCEEMVDETDSVRTGRHTYEDWCEHCRTQDASYCDEGDEVVADDHLHTVYRGGVEFRAATWRLDDFVMVEGRDEYHHCNDLVACETCGSLHHPDDSHEVAEIDGPVCSSCHEEYEADTWGFVKRYQHAQAEKDGQQSLALETVAEAPAEWCQACLRWYHTLSDGTETTGLALLTEMDDSDNAPYRIRLLGHGFDNINSHGVWFTPEGNLYASTVDSIRVTGLPTKAQWDAFNSQAELVSVAA